MENRKKPQEVMPRVPTESEEQQLLIQWAEWMLYKYPVLAYLYHVPNGGLRNKAVAGRLKAEGVRSGVPDIVLPVPQGGYHGLYIELKRTRGGKTSDAQEDWIAFLRGQGYCVHVCPGAGDAQGVIIRYLEGRLARDEE